MATGSESCNFSTKIVPHKVPDTQSKIYKDDPTTKGTLFVPIILGSDKTTILVGTGNNEYYPLYISIGNIHNLAHQA